MKLIIQIPCYNEGATLATTLQALPRSVHGFDSVEWLVVDDGSIDDTALVARQNGVDHLVSHTTNLGLAKAFMTGLHTAIRLGADVIVNTDADNQYNADDIPSLVHPILEGTADLVIGERPISTIDNFSFVKKILQKIGSRVVRGVSNTDVPDAPSGFRAMSRDAATRLNVFNSYTYTLETIIQAGQKGMAITSVPVRVNDTHRPSRLVKNIPSYIFRSIVTIVRIYIVYKPFRFFLGISILLFFLGFGLGGRFLYYFFSDGGEGHVQSVILSGILLGMGFQSLLVAFLADIIGVNRQLLEKIGYFQKKDC